MLPPSSPVPRSPSPVIPGAWPSNVDTRHKRSATCPALCNILSNPQSSLPQYDSSPMHLDRVREFQQRLSLSLAPTVDSHGIPEAAISSIPSEPTSSDSGLSGIGSIPSDGSDLTQWISVSRLNLW